MRRYAFIFAAIIVIFSLHAVSFAACVTHFYNTSNFQWSIAGSNGPQSNLIVASNTTVEIPWGAATTVIIGGEIPQRPYTRQFQVLASGDCFIILHPGNTGNVILNKPNNGDVTSCSGNC